MAQTSCVRSLFREMTTPSSLGVNRTFRAASGSRDSAGAALPRPSSVRAAGLQRSQIARVDRGAFFLPSSHASKCSARRSPVVSVRAERFSTIDEAKSTLSDSWSESASSSTLNLPESSARPSLFDVPGPSPDLRLRRSGIDDGEVVRSEFVEKLLQHRQRSGTQAIESRRVTSDLSVFQEPEGVEEEGNFVSRLATAVVKKVEDAIPSRWRGLILLNVLTFLYGSNITVVKEAGAALDPFSFSAARFSIAALAFTPFLAKALSTPHIKKAGIELGVWASLAYVAQAVGLLTTEAGRASFIGTFTVIEVPILAGLFGAKIPPITWVAALAAICGVGLLESSGGETSFMGDFWTIASALVFGVHILRSEHHAKHVTTSEALPLIALQLAVTAALSTLWVTVGSTTNLLPGCGWESLMAGNWSDLASWPWVEMVYTGVLSTALCMWIEVVALKDVSAPEAAMVYTLEPLWGAGFAWVLLGERWGPMGWAGAALVLGGSVAMQMFGHVEEGKEHGHSPASSSSSDLQQPLLAPVPVSSPSSCTSLVHSDSSSTALSALGVAAAVALVLTASTTGMPVDVATATGSGSGLMSWVRGMGRWSESEMEMVVESERDVEITSAALVALGGEELASLTSLIKAYALVRQDEEDESGGEEELSPVVI